MAQVKKISVAKLFGKVKLSELMVAPNQTMVVMKVLGIAVATQTGESDYGNWTALQGQFEAVNPATGEVQESATLFLPDVALIPIKVALATPGNKGVQFAIEVSVTYVAEREGAKAGGSPYEYSFKHLIKLDESDPIAQLKAKMAHAALPAPDAEPKPDAPVNESKRPNGTKSK